ncbi:MAG: hypothetical protein PWQ77_1622 [Kosmotogales bacterium]|nr:hypothetical protein [Kosmotogales bacterium]
MKTILNINGKDYTAEFSEGEKLDKILRRLGFLSVKHSCNSMDCGTCTVLIDGKPVLSCGTFAASATGKKIETVESLSKNEKLHPLQEALLEENGAQCGFCIPGFELTAKALLEKIPHPNEEEIRSYMKGNLCRCTGYERQHQAIMKASKKTGE